MSAEPLGVVLVSFASASSQQHQRLMYVPALKAHPGFRLVAVADEASAPAEQHALNQREADALGLPYLADLDAALARPDVQVASVCSPLERRVAVIEQIAAAGKHILVDKPMAATIADCDAIERATRAAGVVCMPAYHYRFHPAIRSARASVAAGKIGLPWGVQGDFIIANGTSAVEWGELANFSLYPVDAVRCITGLEVRSVYATRGAFFYENAKALGVEDFGVLALTLDHGVTAVLSVGRSPAATHPNGYGGDRRLRIMGSHGTLLIDAQKPSLAVYGPNSGGNRFYGGDSLQALLGHFAACARSKDVQPELGPSDARAALEVLLAAYRSADDNQVVRLPFQAAS